MSDKIKVSEEQYMKAVKVLIRRYGRWDRLPSLSFQDKKICCCKLNCNTCQGIFYRHGKANLYYRYASYRDHITGKPRTIYIGKVFL